MTTRTRLKPIHSLSLPSPSPNNLLKQDHPRLRRWHLLSKESPRKEHLCFAYRHAEIFAIPIEHVRTTGAFRQAAGL